MEEHFTFVSPPECPVFRPTKEEFKDPLEYIEQIRPIAVKSGICRIIPPDDWTPPFSVNVNTFQFTPRVQKLYELEAQSRIKLNFMTKLSQFVRLQGSDKLKIPNINGRHVDLYKLHKLVHENGGYDHIIANKLWLKIATKMGYKSTSQAYSLRTHYEKIILPYDIMLSADHDSNIYISQSTVKPKPVLHPSTTKKRKSLQSDPIDESLMETSNELKRLQFSGAGPRIYASTKDEVKLEDDLVSGPLKRKCLSDYVCKTCGSGDKEDKLLICDNEECQDCYHCDCLAPPLSQVPKQSWKCHNCVLEVLSKKPLEYGFPSSSITYTLYEFGKSADKFKANYFGKELHELVPCSSVEKEFWRILQSFNDDIIVEYGADIHSSHQGSGFPTLENIKNGKCARNNGEPNMDLAIQYSNELWNLNILPITKKSVLRFIRGNIDGMKVPWCYVGMVFSSFCWHIEDHWSFSINYLHWGEPKTWYGVSSENAEQFEVAMRKQAPELFDNHEDLLHHITTIMNPNILMKEGVPVYRTDQQAGQFVVTFPRAYHAGFNQGFNFAEAVNFCPANWLSMGRLCVEHYAQLHRHCVFSHDELLCTIAEAALLEQDNIPDEEIPVKYPLMSGLNMSSTDICLDTNIRRTVHAELELVVEEERQFRMKIEKMNLTKIEQTLFENLKDDERACCICQTTCFLSAFRCQCINEELKMAEDMKTEKKLKRIVCLRHINNVCNSCPISEWTFLYRFTLEEMDRLLSGLEVRLQDFHSWEADIKAHCTEGPASFTANEPDKRWSLDQLQMRLNEGAECGFDSCEEFVKSRGLLERGQNLTNVCKHWLKAIQNSDDCSKLDESDEVRLHVPKSVLIDCVRENGSVEIKNINVASLTEENLAHMNQTLIRFPLKLPCDQFEQMVARLLQWRQDSHTLMALNMNNPGVLLPKVVHLFEEAKRLFPGWTAFTDERTCLMLLGKSLQWLVRIRECEDAVKAGKSAHLGQSEGVFSLPVNLVKESTVFELVNHGETLISSAKETANELGDLGARFLLPISVSLQPALDGLYDVVAEINRLRDELSQLPKRGGISSQILASLKEATERCLCMGVRVSELDETRTRLYKACVDVILVTKPGRFVDMQHASQLVQLGSALFSEAVLDRESSPLTQKHLSSKTQITLMNRSIKKLKLSYVGCNTEHTNNEICQLGCSDFDFLKILLPRFFSLDQNLNRDRLAHNNVQFLQIWHSCPVNENQIISLMRLYQTMIVEELSSIESMHSNKSSIAHSDLYCCVCEQSPIEKNSSYCMLCKPRSNRPTINEMAQLNKLLKQCPNIVSVYGIALQALSKRTVTWLESLVALIRLHAKYLSRFYSEIKNAKLTVPVCIKELFSQNTSTERKSIELSRIKDLFINLTYLRRVGYCLEVNVESYVAVLSILIDCISNDINSSSAYHHDANIEADSSVTSVNI